MSLQTWSTHVSQLQEATLNITIELKQEPKAADVAIPFVLPLGNGATV